MEIPEPYTQLGHAIFGLLSALAVKIHPVLTVVAFLLFTIYELDETYHLQDEAYQELREYGYGFGLGLLILLALRLTGVT
jgi:hypothetical protein